MKNYLLTITETGGNRPQDEHTTFNKEKYSFDTKEEVISFLTDRYGKMPKGKNKVYNDRIENIPIGFTHSFWNRDISHNSKNWHQTDWVCIYEQELTPASFY